MDIGNSSMNPIPKDHSDKRQDNSIVVQETYSSISQLSKLKNRAAVAITQRKIFAIYGTSETVRKSLVKRGWIEKNSPHRLDVRKTKINDESEPKQALERVLLSNFVADAKPNLIWNTKVGHRNLRSDEIKYNRIQCSHLWTTKLGLCAAVKNKCWSYIEDVAEVNSPRMYACIGKGDLDSFKNDFKLTACTSLLKWLITMVDSNQKVFHESGTINVNVIQFAINRCKEYLFRKQNEDLDKPILRRITNGQWNSFLKKYYSLIARQENFKTTRDNIVLLFLDYARFMLKEIQKYRPEISCEGYNDIWIIKPADASRGRGITIASKLGVIIELLRKRKHIAQKYIEEPLLIYGTKFDIRQYYLVSNAFPLEIWMYKDSYLKFSSQVYNIDNFHESIHLTNNAVQKKYKICENRHPKLPKDNMWSSDTFKEYLIDNGNDNVWDKLIYPGMKKSIIGIMTSCQDSISHNFKNRFELYGCDFILDKDYKPWLIEINDCPDLKPTTTVTSIICPEVVSDVMKVIIDNAAKLKACTGKFECIYRSNQGTYTFDAKTNQNLEVNGHALPSGYFYTGSTSQLDTNIDTSVIIQPDITAILEKLKINYAIKQELKQEPKESNFLEQWKSLSKYNLLCQTTDNIEESEIANTSTNLSKTHKSDIIVDEEDSLSDSISSDDNFSTIKSCVNAEQRSSLFDRIPSDLDSVKRKIVVSQRLVHSAPAKGVTDKQNNKKQNLKDCAIFKTDATTTALYQFVNLF